MAARVVGELAAAVDPGLAAWIAEHVAFVTTMVDRITPHTTDDDRAAVRRLRRGRPGPGGHRALRRVGAVRRVPAGPPPLGGRRGPVRRRHRARGSTASCGCSTGRTRCMAYAGTLRGHDTVDAGDLGPGRARLGGAVVGRRRPAPAAAARGDRGLPGRAAGALREPADPPPAGARSPPTARRRCRSGSCRPCGPTWPAAASRPVRRGCSPRGCATCAGGARRWPTWRPRSSPRWPRASSDDAVGRVLARLDVDDARLSAEVTALVRELGC